MRKDHKLQIEYGIKITKEVIKNSKLPNDIREKARELLRRLKKELSYDTT